jgi:hypothetical protein
MATRRQMRAAAGNKKPKGSTAGMLLRNSVKTTKVSRDKHPSKAARAERAKKKK